KPIRKISRFHLSFQSRRRTCWQGMYAEAFRFAQAQTRIHKDMFGRPNARGRVGNGERIMRVRASGGSQFIFLNGRFCKENNNWATFWETLRMANCFAQKSKSNHG